MNATVSCSVIATLAKRGGRGLQCVAPAMLRIVFFLSLSVLLPGLAVATELKLSTWNLEWLTDRPDGDHELPPDAHPKQPADIDLLQQYATQLDADVIAIEEVDGP